MTLSFYQSIVTCCIHLSVPTSSCSSSLSKKLSIYLLLYVVYIYLCLPSSSSSQSIYCCMFYTSLYLTISLSFVTCCSHIFLYLPPPAPPLYRSKSLSNYCCMLYTSTCAYLLLLLFI